MERVVYLLGAGFSAPLGIPVIKDFLQTAKDLYADEPTKYVHFKGILEKIKQMSFAKNYYHIDLFNIEEILSILDMEDQVTGTNHSVEFAAFVADVVKAKTPPMSGPDLDKDKYGGILALTRGFQNLAFGPLDEKWNGYCQFVANLMNLKLSASWIPAGIVDLKRSSIQGPRISYSIITLNYDRVIEMCQEYINSTFEPDGDVTQALQVAKLHGSVDSEIVAPTWRKLFSPKLQEQWRLANQLLSEANYIRILGYSMPYTDSYIRYLLSAAAINSSNLKEIDILCLDDKDKTVRGRFEHFIDFKFCKFKNGDVWDYLNPGNALESQRLSTVSGHDEEQNKYRQADYDKLEHIHEWMMTQRN